MAGSLFDGARCGTLPMKSAADESEDIDTLTNPSYRRRIDNYLTSGYTHGYGICPQNELLFAAEFCWRKGNREYL